MLVLLVAWLVFVFIPSIHIIIFIHYQGKSALELHVRPRLIALKLQWGEQSSESTVNPCVKS